MNSRPPPTTSISHQFLCKYTHYNLIEMKDEFVLLVMVLAENSWRNEAGLDAWDQATKGECRAHPFFHFRHGLIIFSFDSFAH